MAPAEPSDAFFATLPEIGRFADVAELARYADVPSSWCVVISDVRGSTRAIEAGRYKDVNALGVASIVALQNALPDLPLPYVFGGDGATVLVPATRRAAVEAALRGVGRLARESFELDLRVGVVPVADLLAAGHPVRVARVRVSPHVCLAAFGGAGFQVAERWIKDDGAGARYLVAPEGDATMSLEGFECRWRPVGSARGKIVSLLVLALGAGEAERTATYREVIAALEGLVTEGHPFKPNKMKMQPISGDYSVEARLRSGQKEGPAYDAAVASARKQTQVGRVLGALGLSGWGFDGKTYVNELVQNTDFRKFDDTLRMVLDVSADELEAIRALLEARRIEGALVYGLHAAPSALMTCFVRSYQGDHVHFVDGSDGGYTLAAKQLKEQLRAR